MTGLCLMADCRAPRCNGERETVISVLQLADAVKPTAGYSWPDTLSYFTISSPVARDRGGAQSPGSWLTALTNARLLVYWKGVDDDH